MGDAYTPILSLLEHIKYMIYQHHLNRDNHLTIL